MSVTATARITAVADGRGSTALPVLESEGPLALRRTRSPDPAYTRVTVVGAMSAPLGGDRLAVEVQAGDGARLTVDSAAATVALPGGRPGRRTRLLRRTAPRGGGGRTPLAPRTDRLRVRQRTRPDHPGRHRRHRTPGAARGTGPGRHGERTGKLSTRLTVRRAGRPLLDQQLAYGPGAPGGWDGAAVLGGHRAVGQLLVVDPAFEEALPAPRLLGPCAALTPLAGPAVLVTALAADARLLRAVLDEALEGLLKETKALQEA